MNSRNVLAAVASCMLAGSMNSAIAEEPALKYFVEVKVPTMEAARRLAAAGFDIAGVNRSTMNVGVVVTPDELKVLTALGWPAVIRTSNVTDVVGEDPLYTDPQEFSAFMDGVVAAYPDLARKSVLVDTLFEDQKQYVLHITKDVGLDNDRPAFILDAQHHAREIMTTEIALDMVDYLTSRYATDPQVQRWVDNINIYVVGSVNPEGGMYAFRTDNLWRKNRHPGCAVDLNRNYPAFWGSCNGSSLSCTDETFRGDAAASEPETKGLMQLTADVHPFYALSYHSYGEYLLYPGDCRNPDEWAAFDEFAQGLNAILENDAGVTGQYATGPGWSTIYPADGTSTDTQYALYGAYALTIEVNAANFHPDYWSWRFPTVRRQRTAWGYFLDKTLDGPQVRGTVSHATTGLPLPAILELQGVTFTHGETPRHADAKGHYHLLVHSGGAYQVTYSYPDYCADTEEAVVATGPAVANVALSRRPAPPVGVSAAAGGNNAIDVSWQPVAGADQYRVLRSLSDQGPYAVVATVPGTATSFHDTPVSGGPTYAYVVRAVRGCDSVDSAAARAATSGACTLGPSFAGVAKATNAAAWSCALNLTWPAATAPCGGHVTYRVHRGTTPAFAPSPVNVIASGLTGNSYVDHDTLSNGVSYFYIVRAVDSDNGLDDGNLVSVAGKPTGPDILGTWTDDAGDTGAAQLSAPSLWSVNATGGKSGPKVYATGVYPNDVCAALTSPPVTLAATLQVGPRLSFASKYDLQSFTDAGIVEVATAPTFDDWTKLTVNYPESVAFYGNKCEFPVDGDNAAFSQSHASPVYSASPFTGSMSAYAGQTVEIRWRLSSDYHIAGAGWWVDDIAVTNALIPGTCAAGSAPRPKEASADGGMIAKRAAPGTAVELTFAPACGTLDNAVYWGTGPILTAPDWTGVTCAVGNSGLATFDPSDPAPGSFLYFVIVGQSATEEGSYGTGTAGERPEAIGIGACDKPQVLAGVCP